MKKASRLPVLLPEQEASAFQTILADESPWDAACKLRLKRYDYNPAGELIDPGVNFFVLALTALGARTQYSCEGHPQGFYITFSCPYELALAIDQCGFFSVEICRTANHWRLCRSAPSEAATLGERDKVEALRWAAEAWTKKLFTPKAPVGGGPA